MSEKSYARILGANDRVNVGFMGTNNSGAGLLGSFVKVGGTNVANICDVDTRVLMKLIHEGALG